MARCWSRRQLPGSTGWTFLQSARYRRASRAPLRPARGPEGSSAPDPARGPAPGRGRGGTPRWRARAARGPPPPSRRRRDNAHESRPLRRRSDGARPPRARPEPACEPARNPRCRRRKSRSPAAPPLSHAVTWGRFARRRVWRHSRFQGARAAPSRPASGRGRISDWREPARRKTCAGTPRCRPGCRRAGRRSESTSPSRSQQGEAGQRARPASSPAGPHSRAPPRRRLRRARGALLAADFGC